MTDEITDSTVPVPQSPGKPEKPPIAGWDATSKGIGSTLY